MLLTILGIVSSLFNKILMDEILPYKKINEEQMQQGNYLVKQEDKLEKRNCVNDSTEDVMNEEGNGIK